MKAVFFTLVVLLFLLALVLAKHFYDNAVRVSVASASATAEIYARNVDQFYRTFSRLPHTERELTEAVFGDWSWTNDCDFTSITNATNSFQIGRKVLSQKVYVATFELSHTGAVRKSEALMDRNW